MKCLKIKCVFKKQNKQKIHGCKVMSEALGNILQKQIRKLSAVKCN